MIVPLRELDKPALEKLAHVTLASALTHTADWLRDVAAAREELADALGPEKTALVLVENTSPIAWIAAPLGGESGSYIH